MSNRENVIDRILAPREIPATVTGQDFTRDGTCESDFFITEPDDGDEGFFEPVPGEW